MPDKPFNSLSKRTIRMRTNRMNTLSGTHKRNSNTLGQKSHKKKTRPTFKVITNKPTVFSFTSEDIKYECKFCKEHKPGGFDAHPFYYVNAIKLNTVMLQYLIDNNLLSFHKKEITGNGNDDIYIGFNNFNGLVVEEHTKVKPSDKSFMLVYEKEYNPDVDIINPFDREKLFRDLMDKKIFTTPAYIYNIDNPDDTSNPVVLSTEMIYLNTLINKLNAKYNPRNNAINNKKKENICDSIDDEYAIIKELTVEGVGDVIIVAYPAPDMHQFIKNKKLMDYYTKTYRVFEEYEKILIGLYNAFEKPEKQIHNVFELLTQSQDFNFEGSDYFINNKIDTIPLLTQYQVLTTLFDQEFTDGPSTIDKIKLFKKAVRDKIDELYKRNTNLLNNPNFSLDYVIHHFIKSSGRIEPMIYSVRELEPKYLPILLATQDIIEVDLPRLFGIIKETERFISFYSYYRYGDIFHIKVAKIEDTEMFPHIYKRSIDLDELIYTCQIPDPYGINYWKKYKRVFNIRENLIKLSNPSQKRKFLRLDVYNPFKAENTSLHTKKRFVTHTIKRASSNTKSDNYKIIDNPIFNDATIIKTLVKPYGEAEIYYIYNDSYYYLRVLPNVENLDPQMIYNLFKSEDTVLAKEIYKCKHRLDKILAYDLPIFKIVEGPILITKTTPKKYNLFKKTYFAFPYLKQPIPNYKFLDQFTLSITDGKKRYSDYFIYLLYNIFQIAKSDVYQSNGIHDFTKENPQCSIRICNQKELTGFTYFKVIPIIIDHIIHYVLVIQTNMLSKHKEKKEKHINREVKIVYEDTPIVRYIVWVYDTSKYKKTKIEDINLKMDENRCRSIYHFNGEHLKLIYEALKSDKDLFKDDYHPYNIIINITTGAHSDHFHLQILPTSELYKNDIYANNFSSITESRSKQLIDIVNKLEQYPNYYTNMSKVSIPPRIITNLITASL